METSWNGDAKATTGLNRLRIRDAVHLLPSEGLDHG